MLLGHFGPRWKGAEFTVWGEPVLVPWVKIGLRGLDLETFQDL